MASEEPRPPVIYEDDETGDGSQTDTLTLARQLLSRAPGISSADSTPERETEPPAPPPAVSLELSPIDEGAFDARYEMRAVLGEGGMGAVFLCRDRTVGREVAMKVIRAEHGARTDIKGRFEREARVQGQLEHPSVVPVYDLGLRPDGSEYFTMKRLRGRTFHEIVWLLRQGDLRTVRDFPRRKLLGAFCAVCNAVAFANSRGVLHRDLKPANVMVGDFGEVHIIDWGLAKIVGARVSGRDDAVVEPPPDGGHETIIGEVVGTAGYMAPEQVRGEIDRLDGRIDVYALGAILFELLTLERLHAGEDAAEVLASTLDGVEARPSKRTPSRNVPRELEQICVRATAVEPRDRYPTVRDLLSAVERYLDDHRGEERRLEASTEHAAAARKEASIARAGGTGAEAARLRAMREASSALAADPGNADAMGVLVRLLVEAPRDLPAEARPKFEASQRSPRRAAIAVYAVWFAGLPALAALGLGDPRPEGAHLAVLLAVLGLALLVPALAVGRFQSRLGHVEERLFAQRWHLDRLVPREKEKEKEREKS